MSERLPVTLQINLAPSDLRTARHTVPHQLRQWAGQVDEILFTLDLDRGPGQFSVDRSQQTVGLTTLIDDWCAAHAAARLVVVDYSAYAMAGVANRYFGGAAVPRKDHRGAPFYPYFYGLVSARGPYVLHLDSDVMFGGGSQGWIAEAIDVMRRDHSVAACNPLPGPPTSDRTLRSQTLASYPRKQFAFQTGGLSTRIFLVDRRRIEMTLTPIALYKASATRRLKAALDGHPHFDTAENALAAAMRRRRMIRVDFLGEGGGMWSVHPLYRTERFFARLPSLIEDIESGNVDERQRGDHELNSSMVDWTGARRPLHARALVHLRQAAARLAAS